MRGLSRVLGALLLLTYPLLVYVGIHHWDLRTIVLLLLLGLVPTLLLRTRKLGRERAGAVAALPAAVLALLLAAALWNDRRLILALPVLVNAVLLVQFAASLRGPTPVVERIARLVEPHLSPAEISYCRSVTWLWVSFFLFNGVVAGILAVTGPLRFWALYTGLFSYLLVGAVFAAEFVVRRMRFQRFGSGIHDRFLSWIWRKSGRAPFHPVAPRE